MTAPSPKDAAPQPNLGLPKKKEMAFSRPSSLRDRPQLATDKRYFGTPGAGKMNVASLHKLSALTIAIAKLQTKPEKDKSICKCRE